MIVKLSFGKQLRRLRLPELTLEEVEDAFFDFYPDFFATKMRFVVRPEDFPTKEVVELCSEKDFAHIVAVAKDAGKRSIKIHVSVAEELQEEQPVCEPEVQFQPVVNDMGNGGDISSYFDDVKEVFSQPISTPESPPYEKYPQEPFPEPPSEPPQEPQQEPPQEPPQDEPLPDLEAVPEPEPQTEVPPPSHALERVDPPSHAPERAEFHHSYDIPPPPQSPPPPLSPSPSRESFDQCPAHVYPHQEGVEEGVEEEVLQQDVELEEELNISQELDQIPPLIPAHEPEKVWACPRCTLQNSMDERQCLVCTLLRPDLKPKPQEPDEINKPATPQALPVIDEKESAVNSERAPGHIPRIFGQIGRKVSGILYGTQNSQSSLDENEEKMAEASKNMMKPQPGHFYVQCNNCLQEIFGVRYKCFVCDNFNLCSVCDSKIDIDPMVQHDPLHAFVRIKTPAQCPQRGILAQRNQNDVSEAYLNHRVEICSKLGFDKGQKYEPSQDIVVGWRLRNSGFTTVPHGTTLEPWEKWNTDQIKCPHFLQLPALAPNDEIEARLNIRTPPRPGVYKSTWRLKTPPPQAHIEERNSNRHFGDAFQLTITVFSPFSLKKEEKLSQLFDMGFEDRVRNIELLSKHKWDVFRVISLLTGEVQ